MRFISATEIASSRLLANPIRSGTRVTFFNQRHLTKVRTLVSALSQVASIGSMHVRRDVHMDEAMKNP